MAEDKKSKAEVKKRRWKMLIIFIVFQFVFIGITSPFVIFYGPFSNLKKSVVATAMSTYKHKFIAQIFLSEEAINKILDTNTSNTSNNEVQAAIATKSNDKRENTTEIKIPASHDQTIEQYEINGKKSHGYLLVIKDPTRVRVAYTNKMGTEGQKTSEMAKEHNAVAAINGGAFTDKSPDGKLWAGTGALPEGVLMVDGKVVYSSEANYNTPIEDTVAFTKDGTLIVGENSINDLIKKGVRDAVKFSPTLILNGKVQTGYQSQGFQPRTAIGQRKDGAILFLVMDGRQATSLGASLEEVTTILLEQGAWNAINLDGGSSSTLYYDGDVINTPSDPYGERTVATAIYVEP